MDSQSNLNLKSSSFSQQMSPLVCVCCDFTVLTECNCIGLTLIWTPVVSEETCTSI